MGFKFWWCFLLSLIVPGYLLAQKPNMKSLAEETVLIKGSQLEFETQGEVQVTIVNGDVYIRHGEFSLSCDRAVVWSHSDFTAKKTSTFLGQHRQKKPPSKKRKRGKVKIKKENSGLNNYLEVYAEGGVSLNRGKEHFSAERLIFNFQTNKGLILDGVIRLFHRSTNQDIPIHVRAKEIQIRASNEFFLKNPKVSTCTFGVPHYDFRAEELELVSTEGEGFTLDSKENTFHFLEIPLLYLPRIYGGRGSNFPLKKIRVGRDSDFGTFIYTDWSQNIGDWGDWILELDFRSERGAAGGLDIKYSDTDPWGNRYKGLLDTYYLYDEGEDFDNTRLKSKDRGRVKWDHRHIFPYQIRLDIEISYLSDDNFLNEYFEKETKEAKEQETLFYFRRLHDNHAFTFLTKWRLNDFQNVTEKLPEAEYHMVGEPILDDEDDFKFLENLYFSTENSIGQNRRRVSSIDGDTRLNRTAWRADTDNQFNFPFQIGVININPAAGFRMTQYEESLANENVVTRLSGLLRLNLATHFYRNYQIQSDFFDIENLQHVFTPEIEYRDIYGTTHNPDELIQFDEIDTVSDTRVIRLGLLNRLKTWRGKGKDRKVHEFLYFDLNFSYFPNENRDNEGKDFGNMEFRTRWHATNNLSFFSDGEYNFQDGKMDIFNIGMLYKFLDKGSIFLGDRYIRDDSSIATLNLTYDFSERWSVRFLEQYDLTNKEFTEQKLIFTRYFHRFILDMEFERDEGEGNVGFRVALTTTDLEGDRKKEYSTETLPTINYLEKITRDRQEAEREY